jgi:hypothetical protein
MNSFAGIIGRIQNYAAGLEAERQRAWRPSTFAEVPEGTSLGQWFTGSQKGVAFQSGGMVPGTGPLHATLHGGEGVVSRRGMQALAQLNSSTAPVSAGAIDELRGLRVEIRALLRDLPRQMGLAQRSALALAGRTA